MIRLLVAVAALVTAFPVLAQTEGTTAIGDVAKGSQVTLQGTVERIPDSNEFILTDATGSIEVYLGPTRVPVTVGEAVSVTGFVNNDIGRMDVCASSVTRADGTVVDVPNCDG
jgi:uncharacterized protein YdeI (BOF family)